jgi:hypothetical protein
LTGSVVTGGAGAILMADSLGKPGFYYGVAVPPRTRKPHPPLSRKEKAARRKRMANAQRRREEISAAAKAAGLDRPRHFGKGRSSIEFLLTPAHLNEYYILIRDPGINSLSAWKWLRERGYPLGIHCVRRHRRWLMDRMDRQREAVEMSYMIAKVAREYGETDSTEASASFAEQQMMFSLLDTVRAQTSGEFDARGWQEIHKAVREAIHNRHTIETLRAELGKPLKPESPEKEPESAEDRVARLLGVSRKSQ